MIIKSFTAASSAAALKKVREEMGGDAIVLKTVQNPQAESEARFEVTACLENPSAGHMSIALAQPDERNRLLGRAGRLNPVEETGGEGTHEVTNRLASLEDRIEQLLQSNQATGSSAESPTIAGQFVDRLRDCDLPFETVQGLVEGLAADSPQTAGQEVLQRLVSHLASAMQPSLELAAGDRVVLIGPAGCGKSSLLGKLATRLVALEKRKVALKSLDSTKLAAFDEIAGYAEALGARLDDPRVADESAEVSDQEITLIDTSALPADEHRRSALAAQVKALAPTHVIGVFSVLTRTSDALKLAAQMVPFDLTGLAVTMLDQTHRYGSVPAIAEATGVKIGLMSDRPLGAQEIMTPDPNRLAGIMLGEEARRE